MPRKNGRDTEHQSLGAIAAPATYGTAHTCEPLPTRTGHICLHCGRPVSVTA